MFSETAKWFQLRNKKEEKNILCAPTVLYWPPGRTSPARARARLSSLRPDTPPNRISTELDFRFFLF